jgi:glutamate synthase domain-containing protein 3
VLDESGDFVGTRCNRQMVHVEGVGAEDAQLLKLLIERHQALTGSTRAAGILSAWEAQLARFVKVTPKDYRRVLDAVAKAREAGLSGDEAIEAAFEANIHDASRVGGG